MAEIRVQRGVWDWYFGVRREPIVSVSMKAPVVTGPVTYPATRCPADHPSIADVQCERENDHYPLDHRGHEGDVPVQWFPKPPYPRSCLYRYACGASGRCEARPVCSE